MKIDELGLQIGSSLQLQLLGDDKWFSVNLIGYKKGLSLIISAPLSSGTDLSMILRDGQPLDIRLKTIKYAVKFRSQIIEKRLTPYPLIHLTLPDIIDSVTQLKADMVKLKQDVTLINDDNNCHSAKVSLIGVSFTEAKFKHDTEIAFEGHRVTLTMSFKFSGRANVIVLEGHITSIVEDPISREQNMTMTYDQLDEDDQILLHAYIYERMLINLNIVAERRN